MGNTGHSERFYAELPSFAEFDGFAAFDAYRPLPDDWVVVCGDVRGSTRAIAEGRYKAVNMAGAAVITAVLNACGRHEVPFVFGGDGGLAAVPGAARDRAALALRRLRGFTREAFGLDLRAAAVPVARLRAEGFDVRVRKFALGPNNFLAMFAGGGAERAEELLKTLPGDDPAILAAAGAFDAPDLDGLSCRWEPLASARGEMIALMARPAGAGRPPERYREMLAGLSAILEGDSAAFAPATDRTLRLRWPPRGLGLEARAAAGRGSFLISYGRALFTAALQLWCERRGRRIGPYDAPKYREELKAQTDFRKFDGMLRMVLDVTREQGQQIESWLESAYREGRIVYGLHRDREALMTCLVFSLERSEHVHFIDAAGGGFARAAEGFKARLAALKAIPTAP